jgi:hypothetical protein
MSNIPISSLPVTPSLDGSEIVPIVQGGTTKRTTTAAIAGLASSGAGSVFSFVFATDNSAFFPGSRLLAAQAGVTTLTDGGPASTLTVGIAANGIGNTQIRKGGALTVIGNATNALADVADIAGTAGQVLRVNNGGTALAFGSIDLSQSNTIGVSILPPANGGTGVNNGSSTLTLGGNLTTVGAFASIFRMSAATDVTFPTTGTLATTGGPALPAVVQGDLLYGSATNVLSALAKNTTATRYLSNTGTSNNPAWAQIDLTNGVTGTLPATSGGTAQSTYATGDTLYASAANTLSKLTGNITTAKQYLSQTGSGAASAAPAWATISGADITGAALTKTDDTNVTLTLGGTPTTALLRAASLTLGWTGQLAVGRGGTGLASGTSGGILGFTGTTTLASSVLLTQNALVLGGGAAATPTPLGSLGTTTTVLHGNAAGAPTFAAVSLTADVSGILPLANGGTNANLTASNGGIFYSTASAGAILAGTATANQLLLSGATAPPTWSTLTHPSTAAAGTIIAAGTANVLSATPTPTLGANGGTGGQVTLNGSASGSAAIRVAAAAGTGTIFQLPADNGTLNYLLTTNGSGVTSWVPGGGTGTVTSVVGGGVTITTAGTLPPQYGLVNHSLAVTAGGSALTIALKDSAGNDASSSSPVTGNFRSATGTSGGWVQRSVTGALSLVITSGSTMGVTSSTAFRLWVVLFDDGGTMRLGAINCSTPTQIFPLNEGVPASSVAEGGAGAADSAGVIYTTSTTTAVASKAFLIVGYVEWSSSGLTAGTWTTTNVNFAQSFGPGIRKPGEVMQTIYKVNNTASTNTSSFSSPVNTGLSQAITLSSAANLIRVGYGGNQNSSASSAGGMSRLIRVSGTVVLGGIYYQPGASGNPSTGTMSPVIDFPNSTSATYTVQVATDGAGTATFAQNLAALGAPYSQMLVEEIMG